MRAGRRRWGEWGAEVRQHLSREMVLGCVMEFGSVTGWAV